MMVTLRQTTYLLALLIMIGYLLHIGKPVLLPVLIAVISVYILFDVTARLGQVPVLGRLPSLLRRVLVLLTFTIALIALFTYVLDTFTQVAAVLPSYKANLDSLMTHVAQLVGVDDEPSWAKLRAMTFDRVEIQPFIGPVILSIRGLGGTLFLVVLYASFLTAERAGMARKLNLALEGNAAAENRTIQLINRINTRIGDYLSVKTVVNIILGALSYGVMLLFGIDFALFWAILIALLNYIPYIGSLIGVIFPVLLSLAQFGSFTVASLVAVSLTAAQLFVAGYLEPRMLGRAFNLSPFVVLLALAFWSALWGLPGAVLAVPLTASLIIVMAEIDATRPFAILLSASGKV